MSGGLVFEGQPIHGDQPAPQVDYEVATPEYFRVLGVPVLSGRVFTSSDTLNAPRSQSSTSALRNTTGPARTPSDIAYPPIVARHGPPS